MFRVEEANTVDVGISSNKSAVFVQLSFWEELLRIDSKKIEEGLFKLFIFNALGDESKVSIFISGWVVNAKLVFLVIKRLVGRRIGDSFLIKKKNL